MASNKVIAGAYINKRVIAKQDTIEISTGLFDSIDLNSSHVEKFEVITDIHRNCAIQGKTRGLVDKNLIESLQKIRGDISIRNRNRNIVVIEFFDGKKSLVEVDKKRYELISEKLSEHKTKVSDNDLAISKNKFIEEQKGIDIFTIIIWIIAIVVIAGFFAVSTNKTITENNEIHFGNVVAINDGKSALSEILQSQEVDSFTSAIEETGMEFEGILDFMNQEDSLYTFVFKEDSYKVLFDNNEVKYISKEFGGRIGTIKLYEKGYEPITYDKLIINIGDKIAMSILSEEYIKLHLSNPYEASFNSKSDFVDGRCDNIYYLVSSVNDKDGFGVSNKKEYYIEFRKENGIFSINHVEIDGEIISSKEGIDLGLIRKEASEDIMSMEVIRLEHNIEGPYGINVEGNIVYYIPKGKYEVKTETPEHTLYQLRVHEDGNQYSTIVTILLSDANASAIIDITEDSYIAITEGSVFSLYTIE